MNLTQRQLLMFVTMARLSNFSRASEILHISQPALSRALAEMEAQLGVKLLQRTTRQVTLTSEGERFLPQAQRLLKDMDCAVANLREDAKGLSGRVSLAVGTAFGCTVLPQVVQAFAAGHPAVRLRVIDDNSAGIALRVARAETDLGVGSLVGNTSVLESQLLLSARLGLLGNPKLFAMEAALRTKDFSNLPLLNEPIDTSIMQELQRHGSELVSLMDRGTEVSSLALQLALAQAGVGVAVISALGASHPQASGLRFVPLQPAVNRGVFVFWRRDRALSASAQALVSAIRLGVTNAKLHVGVSKNQDATACLLI
ncbi:MAG: LysR family transcriptional regulator [Rhodoferax sp.]